MTTVIILIKFISIKLQQSSAPEMKSHHIFDDRCFRKSVYELEKTVLDEVIGKKVIYVYSGTYVVQNMEMHYFLCNYIMRIK
jgi:hypothetical protein